MDVPPSRYKVVEQGRRLVVIDTWNGDRPVTRQAARPDTPTRPVPTGPVRVARPQVGRQRADLPDTVITTQPWFDAKGPRRVKIAGGAHLFMLVLSLGGMAAALVVMMWGWPVLVVIGFILAQKRVRSGLRTAITAWLDTRPQR
jgi:hypothetical protein